MQNFTKTLLIALCLLNFSCSFTPKAFLDEDGAATISNISGNRDLKQYDQSGNLYSRFRGPSMENGEKKVRDFIWQHWTEKKRGYIKMTSQGVDVKNTMHYFIEPNEKGEWQIALKQVYRHDTIESQTPPLVSDEIATTIEQIDSGKDDWRIILKTKDGKTVEALPRL